MVPRLFTVYDEQKKERKEGRGISLVKPWKYC